MLLRCGLVVEKIGVAGKILSFTFPDLLEAHRPIDEVALLDVTLKEDQLPAVPRVAGDALIGFRDSVLLALQHLDEVTVHIEEHAREAALLVVGAAFLEKLF